MKDCEAACSTGDSSLAAAPVAVAPPPKEAPPPRAEPQCVCWMCSVSEDSVRKPMEHWLQKKAWFPSGEGGTRRQTLSPAPPPEAPPTHGGGRT